MAILKKMAPSHVIFIKPKQLRDALALAAPGGVVDEVEVNKEAGLIKEMMMKAKKKALEESKMREPEKKNEVQADKQGENKKLKGGKNLGKGNTESIQDIMDELEGKNDKEESKNMQYPWDKLWYCTLIFPSLAQELVEISNDLETNLGIEGALVALDRALMEEALHIDKGT